MKKDERILKYLSGLLSPEETNAFENELKSSGALQEEYKRIKDQLNLLRSGNQGEVNDTYFINLVPRARARMERKTTSVIKYIKYLAPAMMAAILYFLLPFRSTSPIEEEIKKLNDSSKDELLNLIDESASYENNEVIEPVITEELQNAEINRLDERYINTDDILNNLSDEEINEIYNSILNKKIL